MDGGTSIPAGWYDDPAGSGSQRWWAGAEWTEHLSAPEPAPVASSYSPVQAYTPEAYQVQPVAAAPANPFAAAEPNPFGVGPQQYNPMALQQQPGDYSSQFSRGYGNSAYAMAAPVDNSKGWISLAAGVASLILLAVGSVVGAVVFGTLTAVIFAVSFGVRALAARSSGQATALVPPILGMVLAAATVLIYLGSLLIPVTLTSADYDAESYDLDFTDSPELESMYDTANQIQLELYSRDDGSWPTELVADANGAIVLDGAVIGRIAPGQTFTYSTSDAGQQFEFTIQGGGLGQSVVYNSETEEISVWCYETDVSCGS